MVTSNEQEYLSFIDRHFIKLDCSLQLSFFGFETHHSIETNSSYAFVHIEISIAIEFDLPAAAEPNTSPLAPQTGPILARRLFSPGQELPIADHSNDDDASERRILRRRSAPNCESTGCRKRVQISRPEGLLRWKELCGPRRRDGWRSKS